MADVQDQVLGEQAGAGTVVPLPGPSTVRRARRQRRPTGAPPPLPRKIGRSGVVWLFLILYLLASSIVIAHSPTLARLGDHFDTAWLILLAHGRVGWLVRVADGIKIALSSWGVTILGLGALAALAALRRWRHLLVYLLAVFLLEVTGSIMYRLIGRVRPLGVTIVGGWGGFSMPSPPVAFLAAILVGIAYTLVVAGRPRWYAKLAIGVIVAVFALARQYLGIDHGSDAVYGIILGVAIPVFAFRLLTPNEIFPVSYRKAKSAHLDVTGRRGQAIRSAVRDQLGLTVLDIKPVGLAGSGGSTPLRLTVEGDPDTYLFAKLYAKSHVRADRWYKLGRVILYGALEDETPFQTVRRLVEYEDYTLRLLWDLGIPTARPYGIVEITPGREYMLVTEFVQGGVEISEAEVDDGVIDNALGLIRKMWDAGLAHRDIKPANILVRDEEVFLIDPFFVQVRPSPWRQAVDLGNMLLVLAIRTDVPRVWARALHLFTREEIAEALAATRGVASPTQLRASMKRDGRDLLAQFRALAPPRPDIAIQRWSVRRIVYAALVVVGGLVALLGGIPAFFPPQNLGSWAPQCGTNRELILSAQAVPSAALLPCVASLPSGWVAQPADIRRGHVLFWLGSPQAGPHAVAVLLTTDCETAGAQEVPTDQAGTTARFDRGVTLTPRFTSYRYYRFPGGCVTYRFDLPPTQASAFDFQVDAALSFTTRSKLVSYVRTTEDLALCGRGARCEP
jgi:hypothetical protein